MVMVQPADVQDRDGAALGVPTIGELAGALAQAGFLAVRYDKRGFGQSGGRAESATLEDFAQDAVSVVSWLRQRRDVMAEVLMALQHIGRTPPPAIGCHSIICSFVWISAPAFRASRVCARTARSQAMKPPSGWNTAEWECGTR